MKYYALSQLRSVGFANWIKDCLTHQFPKQAAVLTTFYTVFWLFEKLLERSLPFSKCRGQRSQAEKKEVLDKVFGSQNDIAPFVVMLRLTKAYFRAPGSLEQLESKRIITRYKIAMHLRSRLG